jgi:uncharacterized protein YodC (DUF2158 family)
MEPVQEFKVGDVVVLKSGGPRMTVTAFEDGFAKVAWANAVEVICRDSFHFGALKLVSALPTGTVTDLKKRPTKEVIAPTAKRGMS